MQYHTPFVNGCIVQRTQNSTGIIYLPNGKIAVEIVNESGVLVGKKSIPENNIVRRPRPAIAYDQFVVDEMASRGVQLLRVTIIETRQIYMVDFSKFQSEATQFNRGHGDQLMLALSQWTSPTHRERVATQLSMFEVNT